MDINQLVEKALSRRSFLAGAGTAAAATVIGCSDNGTVTLPAASTTYTDIDILNFALNLEYLEAEFYLRAATGSGLSTADIGSNPGTVTVPTTTKVPGLTTAQQNLVNELAYTEQEHVRALRAALGSMAVARPAIDLVNGFGGAVVAANTLTSTLPLIPATFSPFSGFDAFIIGGFVFEDVGVTAYNGAAPLITPAGIASGYLAAAAGIMSVEAYHAAYARTYLIAQTIAQGSTAYPYALYANRIALLRAALSSGTTAVTSPTTGFETLLAGFGTSPTTTASVPATGSTVVNSDANALAYHRTTDQVLHIVYGTFSTVNGSTTLAAGVKSGGFFPNGLNGNITATQS